MKDRNERFNGGTGRNKYRCSDTVFSSCDKALADVKSSWEVDEIAEIRIDRA